MLSPCLRITPRALNSVIKPITPLLPLTINISSLPLRTFTTTPSTMSSEQQIADGTMDPSAPGEQFEIRQTAKSEDYTPNPSSSIKLSPARQRLVDDVIALYSCEPTIERVKRYTPDCVYDDQFVYANDRYKMAGQWFALPKLFKASKNEGYEVVRNERGLIQFRNAQVGFILPSESSYPRLLILIWADRAGPSR